MAEFTSFDAPARVTGTISVDKATADTFGGGQGLITAGKAITGFGKKYSAGLEQAARKQSVIEERNASVFREQAITDDEIFLSEQLQEGTRIYGEGEGLVEFMRGHIEQRKAKGVEAQNTEISKADYHTQFSRLERNFTIKSIGLQAVAKGKAVRKATSNVLEGGLNVIAGDPSEEAISFAIGSATRVIEQSPMGAADKKEYIEERTNKIYTTAAAAKLRMSDTPEAAAAFLGELNLNTASTDMDESSEGGASEASVWKERLGVDAYFKLRDIALLNLARTTAKEKADEADIKKDIISKNMETMIDAIAAYTQDDSPQNIARLEALRDSARNDIRGVYNNKLTLTLSNILSRQEKKEAKEQSLAAKNAFKRVRLATQNDVADTLKDIGTATSISQLEGYLTGITAAERMRDVGGPGLKAGEYIKLNNAVVAKMRSLSSEGRRATRETAIKIKATEKFAQEAAFEPTLTRASDITSAEEGKALIAAAKTNPKFEPKHVRQITDRVRTATSKIESKNIKEQKAREKDTAAQVQLAQKLNYGEFKLQAKNAKNLEEVAVLRAGLEGSDALRPQDKLGVRSILDTATRKMVKAAVTAEKKEVDYMNDVTFAQLDRLSRNPGLTAEDASQIGAKAKAMLIARQITPNEWKDIAVRVDVRVIKAEEEAADAARVQVALTNPRQRLDPKDSDDVKAVDTVYEMQQRQIPAGTPEAKVDDKALVFVKGAGIIPSNLMGSLRDGLISASESKLWGRHS